MKDKNGHKNETSMAGICCCPLEKHVQACDGQIQQAIFSFILLTTMCIYIGFHMNAFSTFSRGHSFILKHFWLPRNIERWFKTSPIRDSCSALLNGPGRLVDADFWQPLDCKTTFYRRIRAEKCKWSSMVARNTTISFIGDSTQVEIIFIYLLPVMLLLLLLFCLFVFIVVVVLSLPMLSL